MYVPCALNFVTGTRLVTSRTVINRQTYTAPFMLLLTAAQRSEPSVATVTEATLLSSSGTS